VTSISVIVPVRNEGERIGAMIRSVIAGHSAAFPLELVIVDDASTDGCCDRLDEEVNGASQVLLTICRLNAWSGVPAARNRGAEAARYPIYVVTDGNTLFPRGWDMPIRSAFRRNRLLAVTIRDMDSPFRGYGCQLQLPSMGVAWLPVPNAYGGLVPIAACTGTVIDRGLFHHLGGYDESLPVYGAAEPEFSLRAWLAGYEIACLPGLEFAHHFRPRAEHQTYVAAMRELQLANYLRFACYYLPEDLLGRAREHYAKREPALFPNVWKRLAASDVWRRRVELAKLPRSFAWFAACFPLMWQA
jgi:glycosyltransferase involved in cell wall biosynthesis